MNYGDNSWHNFKHGNWKTNFSSPSHSGYSFAPYANQSPACGPQRPYNPYNSQREHAHPVGYFRPTHPSPYTLPFCQQKHRPDTNLFVTPNAGMAENQKLCKSDEHLLKRRRLDEFEDFSSQGEAITISVKTQSTVCTISWSLSSRFSSVHYHVVVELFYKNKPWDVYRTDLHSNSCKFHTIPGTEYTVEVRLVSNSDGRTALLQSKQFKAIFSMSELNELFNMSVKFAGKEAIQKFTYLYRVKPRIYFEDIEIRTGSLMEKYVKDNNGHASSPINGEIRGLFFSGQLFNGAFPLKSPFGDRLFFVSPKFLISPDTTNIYFADFYCTGKPHYVTVVLCKKNSPTDGYCKRHIKPLNFYDNPFLRVEAVSNNGQIDYNYYVNDSVHVEICYTEDVHLNSGYFEDVQPVGIGSSRVGGLRNNLACTICNFSKDANALLTAAIEKPVQTPTVNQNEKPKKSSPQKKSPENTNTKRKSSTENEEPTQKQPKFEVPKKTMLIELLEKDRTQRNYPDFSEEIASLVSNLVETVGNEIDLENFQRKIQNGSLHKSLLNQNFLEMETRN